MIYALADNIISPLGDTSAANFNAVIAGKSALCMHSYIHGQPLHEPFMGSLFSKLPCLPNLSPFETLCIRSAELAVQEAQINAADTGCVFVLSTTKGNIWSSPADSAAKIALYFGNTRQPVVVSTACTSGVSAQLVAARLIESGECHTAVIIGCDVQTEFVVSGFQSFKALSTDTCRPFDKNRSGLNAGEAVATLILSSKKQSRWQLLGGTIHNDANHISGPSRTAEGSLRCLEDAAAVADPDSWAFLSVHGTGTLYNDEMEAIAINRAGVQNIPVSALKGYYGHTMGAAGLLETILSMRAVEAGVVIPTKGYEEQGTSFSVNISPEIRKTNKQTFVKLLSGFGGVNAVAVWQHATNQPAEVSAAQQQLQTVATLNLSHDKDNLSDIYRTQIGGYPKFHKMDLLSKVGFIGVELLLKNNNIHPDGEHTAVIMANHCASLKNDTDYQATIADHNNYYPSPALFVYTLPNIVTGEIAIRHRLYAETAFYILQEQTDMKQLVDATLRQSGIDSAIVAWIECPDNEHWYADFSFIRKI